MKYLQKLVIPHVGDKWYSLGVELLEVDQEDKLRLIESNERDVESCCSKMFRYWLQTHPSANWHHLIAALRSRGVELLSLAADLEKKFSGRLWCICEAKNLLFVQSYLLFAADNLIGTQFAH